MKCIFVLISKSAFIKNIRTLPELGLIDCFLVFYATFSNISAISWRPVLVVEEAGVPGENHRRTMGKQLVNFITCGCESSAPFFVIYKAGREPTPYW
jgi:hypothetical protein